MPNQALRTANTEKSLLYLILATAANRKWCLKKNKSLRRRAKGTTYLFLNMANRKRGLKNVQLRLPIGQKVLLFFFFVRRLRKKIPQKNKTPTAKKIQQNKQTPAARKTAPNFVFACGERMAQQQQTKSHAAKMLRAQNRVMRRAQSASRRLLRRTVMLTQLLRPRNSATAN